MAQQTSRLAKILSLAAGIRSKVGVALGTIGLFNILSKLDGLKTTSTSLKILVSWWRYAVGSIFTWFHIAIPALAQDILVVWGLALAAADLSCRATYGFSIWRVMLPVGWPVPAVGEKSAQEHFSTEFKPTRKALPLLLFAFASWITLGVMVWPIGAALAFSSACAVVAVWLILKVKNPPDRAIMALMLGALPVMVTFQAMMFASIFWRTVRVTAGLVILLLALNLLFAYVVDPIRPLISNIPMAPPPPR